MSHVIKTSSFSRIRQNTLQMYVSTNPKYCGYEVIKYKYKILSGNTGKYKYFNDVFKYSTFENAFPPQKKIISLLFKNTTKLSECGENIVKMVSIKTILASAFFIAEKK